MALLGIKPMVCSRKEQRTFLEGGGSSVRGPERPPEHSKRGTTPTGQRPSRSLFLMKLAATQQPLCDVGGLQRCTFGR
jgi:hypothetical protein